MLETLAWTGSSLRLLDQTRLPLETVYVEITDEKEMWDAIKRLVVRGAPAIGVAGAFGAYLGLRSATDDDPRRFILRVDQICDELATSRPTAVNLFWALDRIRQVARESCGEQLSSPTCFAVRDVQDAILNECLAMLEQDKRRCRAIGEHGVSLLRSIKPGAGSFNILTHCNAGSLATVAYGTALAPIYVGVEQGLAFHVFADETRPLLQGSRITAYELQQSGIPVTVLCDNMAATLLGSGKIDVVIVGADRIAANGDAANKIGTHGLAIIARHFGVPFIVAAPTSTIDLSLPDGSGIPIEQRDPSEVTCGFGKPTAPHGVAAINPAFDVTPASLLTAIITEAGIVRPPFDLRAHAANSIKNRHEKVV